MADTSKITECRKDLKHDALPPHLGILTNDSSNIALQKRLEQREALKAFRLTKDPGNAFSIDMGSGNKITDNRPILATSKSVSFTHSPEKMAHDTYQRKAESERDAAAKEEQSEKPTHLQIATKSIIETASARFGAEDIRKMHIAHEDVGSAVSALLLGPSVCNSLGVEGARSIGKRLLVFGVAPVLGMADEAHKQFTQSPMQTLHEASANYLTGAAIGALLERVHPAVMTVATAGGASLFLKDQLSSPEHRARNREISAIASRLDGCSNTELLSMLERTRTLIGPELFKGTFMLATGGPGLPEGGAVKVAIKQEARSVGTFNAETCIKHLHGMGNDAWEVFKSLLNQEQMKPSLAGTPHDFSLGMASHESARVPENFIDRTLQSFGDRASTFTDELQKIKSSIREISAKPTADVLDDVESINKKLLAISKHPVPSREYANTLASVEHTFMSHMKTVLDDFSALKPQADAIQLKRERTGKENDILDKFFAAEDTLYAVVTERLKSLYGWNEHVIAVDNEISNKSGAGTQREISNAIASLFNDGLDKTKEIRNALEAKGLSQERAKGWVGIPVPAVSGADHAGCDYLLVNKYTGEFYPLDVTERTLGMRNNNIVETRLTNPQLEFPDKNVPLERRNFVIGVAPPLVKDNLTFRLISSSNISRVQATSLVEKQAQKQLADIIGNTIAQPSKLNLFDTPLPSISKATPASRQAYELWCFRTGLEKIGYTDWARAMTKSIGFIKSQNSGVPFYD